MLGTVLWDLVDPVGSGAYGFVQVWIGLNPKFRL